MSEEFREESREERIKLVKCPICEYEYGDYLHSCPQCGITREQLKLLGFIDENKP